MKEYIDLLIEKKWRKRDYFATFISAKEKITSPNVKKFVLHQCNEFIDIYKTFFDKYYELCIKELLTLSIEVTEATVTTFD